MYEMAFKFSKSIRFCPAVRPRKGFSTSYLDALIQVSRFVALIMHSRVDRYAPIGVCCLIASALLLEEDLSGAMTSLGLFIATVCVSHIVHAFLFLPVMYVAVMRKNPLPQYVRVADALAAGMAPPSSYV